jgi:hypothetical protein
MSNKSNLDTADWVSTWYEDIGDTLVSAWSPVSVAREQAVDERECRAEWMICMPLGHMAEPAA